ncbi:DNA/RNA nuclease SfsA [Aliidiomarina minuta]|uniref:Sugar fermentation stimulation protein homolog n=1 Tax=Aliidiomarina minuta TaxID=880057 RepID=A0A432W475_9GAMM|nr:DNA/RNA nuclease SfsA [Aliidiomarina minuta]RUO24285.1 DNA/RNA nuclease SfsA [Aliidiomarina minuta]
MQFQPPLKKGRLQRRHKRFLADISTPEQPLLTIHCPNTGAMTGCAEPDFTVWYSQSDNPKRKYPNTWELATDTQQNWIVINTQHANQIAEEAVRQQKIPSLSNYQQIRREVRYGDEKSRIDFLLHSPGEPDCYIEVKSVTLNESGTGFFPDAVSVRARKHVRELMLMRQQGHRAMLLFVVAHSAIQEVRPARHIDPEYADLCIKAAAEGVELRAIRCNINAQEITPGAELTVHL